MVESTLKNLVSEFVGTYLLIFTVGCNIIAGSTTWGVLSIASTLMISIYCFGSVSGAHFNPAVTVAAYLAGGMGENSLGKAVGYIFTQVIAGISAGFSYVYLFGVSKNLAPVGDFTWKEAMAAEVFYTFMLCFVVLRVAVASMNPAFNEYFALAIGFVVVAGGYGAGNISGGCFNPAVALGIDTSSAGLGWGWSAAYTGFELLGALLAVVAHKAVDVPLNGEPKLGDKARIFVSEFLGTFFLVLTVGFNVALGSEAPALSIGASLMCMIYALGSVSGGHFNPAVTAALVIAKKAALHSVPLYFGAQLLGGIAAGITYVEILADHSDPVALAPGEGHNWTGAAVAETVYTFLLCFVVMNVAALSDGKHMTEGGKSLQIYALAIGFCIVAGGNAVGSVSGASLNPAVSFGLDTAQAVKGGSWSNCLTYSAFEFLGASIAAASFLVVRDESSDKL